MVAFRISFAVLLVCCDPFPRAYLADTRLERREVLEDCLILRCVVLCRLSVDCVQMTEAGTHSQDISWFRE